MLDLNQIALFVEVVRAGSFAEAARRLRLPPNAVSRSIQQLEVALDTRLIHRSTRKLAMTAAGTALFERCADAISALSRVGQESIDDNKLPSGLIRVAAPNGFFDLFRIDWVVEFLTKFPKVRMEFVLTDAKTNLIDESIDVAFRAAHLLDPSNIGQKLLTTHFVLVASPAYLALCGPPADLAALGARDCVPQSNRTGPVVWRLEGPRGPEEVPVVGRFIANTAQAVRAAALAGLGIALLPEPMIAVEIAAGRLVKVLGAYRRAGADLYAVYLSNQQIPRAASAFVEFAIGKVRLG